MKSILRAVVALMTTIGCSVALSQPLTVVLRLHEKVALENLAFYAKSRGTPLTRAYTSREIRQIAGPLDADYDSLLKELRTQGFEILNQSPTHLWVTVRGDSQRFEDVFQTRIQFLENGEHRNDGRWSIPANLGLIASLTGLDNTRHFHPHYRMLPQTSHSSMGGIAPDTIREVYGFAPIYKQGITGEGQHIAIATYDGFKIKDVTDFYSKLKLKPGPSVDQVTFNGTPKYDEGSAGETELDAEFSGMVAPGASVHVFASASNDDVGEMQAFTAILDDGRSQVVNYSWGACEKSVEPQHQADMDKVFARAVAQGVNIFVATGDSGSDSCQDGSVAPDWPAGNANIVAVGGTSLDVYGSQSSESGWDGSGGGISGVFGLPPWQTGLGSTYGKRSYPDVAFNADPYTGQAAWVSSYGHAGWQVVGGTSMAAPHWAGFMALVNQARAQKNLAPLGFLNPVIYSMSPADQKAAFNDVTSGSNGGFHAGPGWDAVTGLGSMHGDVLLEKLSQ